jgi:hypothetical protein
MCFLPCGKIFQDCHVICGKILTGAVFVGLIIAAVGQLAESV